MRTEQSRPTERRSQAERRADSERRLLQASAELIVERGLELTSLADIGRRAGASHAAVNHRFGSKDELVDRLIEEGGAHYAATARVRLRGLAGLDAMLELCRLYLDLVDDPDPIGRVHVVLWSEAVAHTAERRAAHLDWDRRLRDFIVTLLEDAIARGEVDPDLEVAPAAISIVGSLRGIAMQLLLDPARTDLRKAQAALDLMVRDSLVSSPASG
ncbi:MAG: TetR/AcrR family transcriptional regulator [Marmoricola sp.]